MPEVAADKPPSRKAEDLCLDIAIVIMIKTGSLKNMTYCSGIGQANQLHGKRFVLADDNAMVLILMMMVAEVEIAILITVMEPT